VPARKIITILRDSRRVRWNELTENV